MTRSVLKLVIEDEGGTRTEIPLEQDELTIGRDASNHVQLRDRNISRHHCRLFRSADGLLIEDLQSSNGLSVNGDMMTGRRPVQVGDRIEVGDYRIFVQHEADGAAVGPRPGVGPGRENAASKPQKRSPTPIPKFPGLPRSLEVTPGPPRALAYRQAAAQHPPPAEPPSFQAQPTGVGQDTPGPKLAPLPSVTPGPGTGIASGGGASRDPFSKTPGPNAPTLAITPGPAASMRFDTPGPLASSGNVTPGPTASSGNVTPGPTASNGNVTPGPASTALSNTPGPGIAPSVPSSKEGSRLVILSGELAGTSIALPPRAAWLGSDPEADLVLPHPSVAPRHCQIEPLTSRGYRIVRLSPDAELSVNGTSSSEALFRPDDLIRIGAVLLRFVEGAK